MGLPEHSHHYYAIVEYRVYEQLDQTVAFSSIQAEIPMEEIYSGINFESQKSN
ncbi:hypothetical protein [Runella limosa]|uniref:hypothetical protein n=1 Tax=Runella limosa TaxID=370978 RepID=UPI000418A1E9|nr:hypothetical protein [Runella limosa]